MTELEINNYSFINLFPEPTDVPKVKNVRVDLFKSLASEYDIVFSLGGFVDTVLNKIGINHFALPHPSPRNRLFNNKEYEPELIERCQIFMENYGKSKYRLQVQ